MIDAATEKEMELREFHATAIGSSEIPTIMQIGPFRRDGSPFKSWLDLWWAKDTASHKAVFSEIPSSVLYDEFGRSVGHIFEHSLAMLYRAQTGRVVRKWQETIRHPDYPWAIATPDFLAGPDDLGETITEGKMVGFRMRRDWNPALCWCGVPEYVFAQVQWQMWVCRAAFKREYNAAVVALIGGPSDDRVEHIAYDPDYVEVMAEMAEWWWNRYVVADVEPPPVEHEPELEYVRKLHPKAELVMLDIDDPAAVAKVEKYRELRDAADSAKILADDAEAEVKKLIGKHEGIRGPFGECTWKNTRGSISWKDIALEVAGGEHNIPDDMKDRHRGEEKRQFRDSPPKP